MRDLLSQIEQAAESHLYLLALYTSLTVPDLCGALGSEDGQANRARYIAWFDQYVGHHYRIGDRPTFTGEACYFYRCGVLHQGRAQHPRLGYARILFVEPAAHGGVFHNNVLMDALNIDVRVFCGQVIQGALAWLQQSEHTENFRRNYSNFMRRHPNGLAPYIVGIPVIA